MRTQLTSLVIITLTVAACDPDDADRGIDVSIASADLTADRSYPDAAAAIALAISINSRDHTENELVSLDAVGLYEGGSDSPLVLFSCSFPSNFDPADPLTYQFATVDLECAATNAALSDFCGDELTIAVSVNSADCDCVRNASAPITVACLPDNRATAYMALEGAATPVGKPIAVQTFMANNPSTATEVMSYAYDDAGRLWFKDLELYGAHVQRTVFEYGSAGYYANRTVVDCSEDDAWVIERSTYGYDDQTRLIEIARDGGGLRPDGVVNKRVAMLYDQEGTSWTRETDDGCDGSVDESRSYSWNADTLTLKSEDDFGAGQSKQSMLLASPLDNPNQVLLQELAESGLEPISNTLDEDGDGTAEAILSYEFAGTQIQRAELRDAESDALVMFDVWVY